MFNFMAKKTLKLEFRLKNLQTNKPSGPTYNHPRDSRITFITGQYQMKRLRHNKRDKPYNE